MVRPRSDADDRRYGLGFWLHGSLDIVDLHGYDAGVSFRSVHDPKDRLTHTVVSNTSKGAWAISRHLDEVLMPSGRRSVTAGGRLRWENRATKEAT